MASSITALATLPANFSRVTSVRAAVIEEVSAHANTLSRRDQSERVIEVELLQGAFGAQGVSRAEFTIDDIIGVQADIGLDPRFAPSPGVASTIIAANDALAVYVSSGAVFAGVQRQIDTFV